MISVSGVPNKCALFFAEWQGQNTMQPDAPKIPGLPCKQLAWSVCCTLHVLLLCSLIE